MFTVNPAIVNAMRQCIHWTILVIAEHGWEYAADSTYVRTDLIV